MTPFSESSYLAQVKRLRRMAEGVVTKFPLKNYNLTFIHHGENATFKVTTPKECFLLRLHRNGYHSAPAILEELRWLKSLCESTDIPVQRPLLSHSGKFVELASGEAIPDRNCSILEWLPGRMRFHKLTPKSFYAVGELTARLHRSASKRKIQHRDYWTAEGLLGAKAKLGSLLELRKVLSDRDFSDLEKCRRMAFLKISEYQKRYPERLNLIHADLHFGNMLWDQGRVLPIDFDDCGLGFELMDLAVTLYSSSSIFKKQGAKTTKAFAQALLDGYCSVGKLSTNDLAHLPYFILTRKLAMVGWLYQRRDNPRLLKYFNKSIIGNISEFRKALTNGPSPIF